MMWGFGRSGGGGWCEVVFLFGFGFICLVSWFFNL